MGKILLVMIILLASSGIDLWQKNKNNATGLVSSDNGIHKIKHVVIIMQENRSFDSYFGTFPGGMEFP